MSTDDSRKDLFVRLQANEPEAAEELVRLYEPEVRRFVRFRLSSPWLRRILDSLDICQSVLASFFVHLSRGEVELKDREQLRALLLTMARNKLFDQVRKQKAVRRDQRRLEAFDDALGHALVDSSAGPGEQVAARELFEAFEERLSEEERYLFLQRTEGRGWNELAAELETGPEALRKRLARAIDRVAAELGLIEDDHG